MAILPDIPASKALAVLRAVAPIYSNPAQKARQDKVLSGLAPALFPMLAKYRMNVHLRASHFLGQTCVESDGFRALEEYASGAAYEGRANLGNTQKGDGIRYKGRSLLQITGRDNYSRMATLTHLPLVTNPELAAQPEHALDISLAWWDWRNLNEWADRDDVTGCTRIINGGYNALKERGLATGRAKAALAGLLAADMGSVQDGEHPILHRGSFGPDVGWLQQLLRRENHLLAIDQDFGAATETAIKSFQADEGLVADGIVGIRTWAALLRDSPVMEAKATPTGEG